MFEFYHKRVKKYERQLFTILLALIVFAFVFSGVGTGPGPSDPESKEYAVETPSVKLTRPEFDNLLYRWDRSGLEVGNFLFQLISEHGTALYPGDRMLPYQLFGQFADSGVKRRVAVDVAVLLGAATDAGIRVSDREVEQRIKESFGRQGGYDDDKYHSMLKDLEIEATDYEKTVREYLAVRKYLTFLDTAVAAPTEDVLNVFMKTHGRAKGKFIFWDDVAFRKEAEGKVGAHEIAAYLDAAQNYSEFRRAERIRLEYLNISIEDLKAGLPEPTAAEITEYYAGHKEDFRFPVYGPPLPPPEFLTPMAAPPDAVSIEVAPVPRYKTEEEAKSEIVDKIRTAKAQERAGESVNRILEAAFNLKLEGNNHPDLAVLAREFGLTPATTESFSVEDTEAVEALLGKPQPGRTNWTTFLGFKPETAPILEIRTDKSRLLARLAEKTPAERYLFTSHIRSLAVKRVASNTASRITSQKAQAFVTEFKKRFDAAYAAKLAVGTPTDEELAILRFDTFSALAIERKLTVKETKLVTRQEDIPDVSDDRPFAAELFNLEAKGDARHADGNSGQYVIQLVDKRPPDPDVFVAKRAQLEQSVLAERVGKFVTESLAQYKKDNCRIAVVIER